MSMCLSVISLSFVCLYVSLYSFVPDCHTHVPYNLSIFR